MGYSCSDGYFEPHPGCKRAVTEAIGLLNILGHDTIKVFDIVFSFVIRASLFETCLNFNVA